MTPQKNTYVARLETAAAFAKKHYAKTTTFSGLLTYDHCRVVAQQAEVITKKLYQDVKEEFLPSSVKHNLSLVVQAGLLHEVLNVSACSFEKIAEVAGVQVATTVADLSRDYRLVETRRDIEFRGRISQSTVAAQIIVLSDVITTVRELDGFFQKTGSSFIPKAKKILSQIDGDLLALHPLNRYYILRLYTHAAKNSVAAFSQKIAAHKKAIKLQKFLERKTKSLREKVAANKEKETKKPKPVKKKTVAKKKGVSRGKKSSRKNS